jgi:hypothetical protein
MFESLASCFAFRCSAALNMTALVKIAVLHTRKGRAGSPLHAVLQFRVAARTEWRALPEIHLRIFRRGLGKTDTKSNEANRFSRARKCFR